MNSRPLFRAALSSLAASFLLLSPALSAADASWSPRTTERVAIVGNSLAERMTLFGNFETLLHSRFPHLELVVRNFAWPADEVGVQQRPNDYTKIDDPLQVFGPETFLCFFGFNESFAGPSGIDKFKADYEKWLDDTTKKFAKDGKRPQFVLVSPIAFENTGNPLQPNGSQENIHLKAYTAAVKEVAARRGLPFVDVFTPSLEAFSKEPGAQYTVNGIHVNDAGDRLVAATLERALFGQANTAILDSPAGKRMREAIKDKSWVHQQDYRMLNGWYVYGGRRTWDTETFPREYKKIRGMAALRDRRVWDLAKGKAVSDEPDDSTTGELIVPKTRFGEPRQAYSEPKELRYLTGEEGLKEMTAAEGFEVSLFAAEEKFPELAKPVQLNFDNKGRLWVSTMPSYPQWRPGDPKPNDKLVIFEDTNRDGKADKSTVFYDKLHCPTGFEFWNGGVLVVDQPRIIFLKDTDGDDKADQVTELWDGWATDDTHHTVGAWELSHGGVIHMLEGVSMSTAVETPYGPFRNKNTPGAYKLDPLTLRISHFITPGYGNPWCYLFDPWGQGIVGDGTTAQQHWDSPLSTSQKVDRKGLNPIFNNEGMRPVIGSEFLYSRHFPDNVQGQFVYACVINMNGITRFNVWDDGAGFGGKRTNDLLKSTDRNFRPVDPLIGPDGALWFGDWHNPLIGHMQYSQRDPNRDHVRGRLYRLTAKGRPLNEPIIQAGKPVNELLNQLNEYEHRVRYRARRELWSRPKAEVLAAVSKWAGDNADDKQLCEAMWVQQGFHAVDPALLKRVLAAKTYQARAAGVHTLAEEWQHIPNALGLLKPLAKDPHPRVRLEVVRALSFIETSESVELLLEIAAQPIDYWLDYTLQHAFGALRPLWKDALAAGDLGKKSPEGLDYLKAYQSGRPELGAAQRALRQLISFPEMGEEERKKSMTSLAGVKGKTQPGKDLFDRVCISCHKIGSTGSEYGPDLSKVGSRMSRVDIIESILYPNEKVDPKYLSVNVTTKGGDEISGLVTEDTNEHLTILVGAGNSQRIPKNQVASRQVTKVSNMPEGLGAGMSPEEFVDLVEYLSSLK